MNCCNTKLYLGGDEKETTEYFSAMLGKETIDVRSGNMQRGRNQSSTISYAKQARELMMPDEIAHMPDSDCFVLIKGLHPFYSQKYDIKTHKNYKKLYDPEEHPENFYDYRTIITPKMPRNYEDDGLGIKDIEKQESHIVDRDEEEEINLKQLEISIASLEGFRYAVEYEL